MHGEEIRPKVGQMVGSQGTIGALSSNRREIGLMPDPSVTLEQVEQAHALIV